MTLTPDKAIELRKPFPKSAVGKLPKGGVMLDYVGHAAVTDRLLSVDPTWTWEPLALDGNGLPALDSRGNLWIRLTVCGVTRVGVGDGKSAKEVIGDAIRNAAMRFGVALDLWSKEELEGGGVEPEQDAPAPEPTRTPPTPVAGGGGVTEAQIKALGASFRDANITEREERLAFVADTIGSTVESSKDLTKAQASKVIDALKQRTAAPAPTPVEEPPIWGDQ